MAECPLVDTSGQRHTAGECRVQWECCRTPSKTTRFEGGWESWTEEKAAARQHGAALYLFGNRSEVQPRSHVLVQPIQLSAIGWLHLQVVFNLLSHTSRLIHGLFTGIDSLSGSSGVIVGVLDGRECTCPKTAQWKSWDMLMTSRSLSIVPKFIYGKEKKITNCSKNDYDQMLMWELHEIYVNTHLFRVFPIRPIRYFRYFSLISWYRY